MAAAELPRLADLADLGKAPVSAEAPAGADASYDPDYEALQREIDKLSMVSAAGQSTDWPLSASLAVSILAGKSKDLKVAAYLSEALTRTSGFDGLACGTHVLRQMVEAYWPDLFPPLKRLRGRLNAIGWWNDRARAFLEGFEPDPLPAAVVDALVDDLTALDAALAEKAEEAPSLRPLLETVRRFPVQAAPEEPASPLPDAAGPPDAPPDASPGAPPGTPAAPEAASLTEPAPPTAPGPPPSPAVAPRPAKAPPAPPAAASAGGGSPDQAQEQLKAGLDLLFSASYGLLTADPKSPQPYRLARLAAWLPLTAPPPAQNGKTMIPPPPPPVRAALNQAMASGNFAAAIVGAESHVREYRFWLDLSRISADGLRGLAPGHEAALDALETETAFFLRRLPGLAELTFADGMPFADDKTRLWLSRLTAPSPAPATAAPAGEADGAAVAAALGQARDLAAQNQAVAAVTLLQDKLASAGSGRRRLRWRIGLVEILAASGYPEAARPIAEQILAAIDAHTLDEFDPDLALSGLLAARQALATAKDEAGKARAAEVLSRIMRLNPAQGLRLSGIT
ncbi:MAG: type VI secretion system protein TssA [Solidesulfovibrio sp. DCME]|uniref:type VI secretion system protein TssA n=1 Tax=Solidesulfovibrio sp. DCME TaxID=3447380 RepID=UPI003D0980CE